MRISDWSSDVCSSDLIKSGVTKSSKTPLRPSNDVATSVRQVVGDLEQQQRFVARVGDGIDEGGAGRRFVIDHPGVERRLPRRAVGPFGDADEARRSVWPRLAVAAREIGRGHV